MKYRIVLINTKTNERRMVKESFTSRKKAIEFGTKFSLAVKDSDFEVIKK